MTSEHTEQAPVPLSVSVSQNVASDKPNQESYASRICHHLEEADTAPLRRVENAAVNAETATDRVAGGTKMSKNSDISHGGWTV